MSARQENSTPSVPARRVAIVLGASIAFGVCLAQLETIVFGARTRWVDVGLCALPLLHASVIAYGLAARQKPHYSIFMLLYAGLALAPLLIGAASAAWYVAGGALWSMGMAGCALGSRRAGAAVVLLLGCLLSGFQLSRLL